MPTRSHTFVEIGLASAVPVSPSLFSPFLLLPPSTLALPLRATRSMAGRVGTEEDARCIEIRDRLVSWHPPRTTLYPRRTTRYSCLPLYLRALSTNIHFTRSPCACLRARQHMSDSAQTPVGILELSRLVVIARTSVLNLDWRVLLFAVVMRALGHFLALVRARARVRIFADSSSLTWVSWGYGSSCPVPELVLQGWCSSLSPLRVAGFRTHTVHGRFAWPGVTMSTTTRAIDDRRAARAPFHEGESGRADHSRMCAV